MPSAWITSIPTSRTSSAEWASRPAVVQRYDNNEKERGLIGYAPEARTGLDAT